MTEVLGKDASARMGGGLGALVAALVVGGLAWPSGSDESTRAPRVVRVIVHPGTGPAVLATGFETAPGQVVTVAHALEGRTELAVRRGGGAGRRARVLWIDRRNDLALLAVAGGAARSASDRSPTGARPLATGADAAEDGARVLVRRAGRIRALPALVRRRIMARVRSPAESTSYRRPALELAVDVTVGDSGAPLIDPEGRVVGVLFARSRTRSGRAYAVDGKVIPALLRAGAARSG